MLVPFATAGSDDFSGVVVDFGLGLGLGWSLGFGCEGEGAEADASVTVDAEDRGDSGPADLPGALLLLLCGL
jgi:hypothetical protein